VEADDRQCPQWVKSRHCVSAAIGTSGWHSEFPAVVRITVLLSTLLAACSGGPQADLQYIKQARSIAAEWALVNEQAAAGKLTPTYVSSMHQWLRKDLQTAASGLTKPNSAYGREVRALMGEPAGASPAKLRARAERLKRIEEDLESD
jgi:hypothetical protein